MQVFDKHICACDAVGISTVFSSFFFVNWTCYDALIMFHQEALLHPSRTLFQPEVHSKCDHISKMRLRANQAFLLISTSEDSLGKYAEGWKKYGFHGLVTAAKGAGVEFVAAVIKQAPIEGISPWMSQNVLRRGIRTAREHLPIGFNPVLEFPQELYVHIG